MEYIAIVALCLSRRLKKIDSIFEGYLGDPGLLGEIGTGLSGVIGD